MYFNVPSPAQCHLRASHTSSKHKSLGHKLSVSLLPHQKPIIHLSYVPPVQLLQHQKPTIHLSYVPPVQNTSHYVTGLSVSLLQHQKPSIHLSINAEKYTFRYLFLFRRHSPHEPYRVFYFISLAHTVNCVSQNRHSSKINR